ncbi:homocitrate synthase [Apiospora phragmitis]|uniref:Homocitrate synthase n=1 Tax=Apiospora phragmitis TaxID=2905665 RepID=A0ABR1VEQ6_9PEZI
MAGRKRAAPGAARSTRSTRTTCASSSREAVPEVYRQMLSDAEVRPNVTVESPGRPAKRRKPGEKRKPAHPPKPSAPVPQSSRTTESDEEEEEDIEFEDVGLPIPTIQTIMRDTDEEQDDDEDDELEFENINFSLTESKAAQVDNEPKEIQLDLTARANATPRRIADKRKPVNKIEKDRRVEIHKTHLLCLLSHVARRNRWCNDAQVQRTMKKLLTNKMLTYLKPGSNLSQFGQTNSLKEGLSQLEEVFTTEYTITERGMRRALWADSEEQLKNYQPPDDAETSIQRSDFREAAESLKGSRDVGAQLYCALLRSAGIEARLVCSLQPLSFAAGGPFMSKVPRSKKYPSAEERLARQPKYDSSFESPGINKNVPVPSALRRLGHPNATAWNFSSMATASTPRPVQETTKKIRECPFPIYWVEVLDKAHQKWQPVDPLVTHSFWKPKMLEPPANERDNCMRYVVGFEADGSAVDVTRRYAKAYNAKTRKMRIESVAGNGDRWWRKALKAYSRGYTTDMDQIESNELAAAEAREPMPRNVADFKDHPIYALERHLRRNEVLVPGAHAAGTVGAGSKGPLERIYRRKDVRVARTREKWYRMGREVPGDEIPVKFLPKPTKKQMDAFGDEGDADEGGEVGTPIFTIEQTKLYEPPPVVNGVIPKNRFRNLDVYVPSMVPKGGAYVADDLATHAAHVLGIDYAPALTGFQFRGRKGTAVLYGAVVAAEHEEAVRAVIGGLRDVEADMERERRTREVLQMWKRFLMNLRVRQRIWAGVEEGGEDEMDQDEVEKIAEEEACKAEEHAEESEAEGRIHRRRRR